MAILLRPAVPADEEFLLGLTPRLADFPIPEWRTKEQIAAADHPILRDALHGRSHDSLILIAEDPAGTPRGYVFATTRTDYFTGLPHAHVEVLAVDSGTEGRGLARALMSGVETWAAQRGYDQVTLNVFATNGRARAVYEHLGYEAETLHYRKGIRR